MEKGGGGGVNNVYSELQDIDDPCKEFTSEGGGVEHIRVVARVRPLLQEEAAVSGVESVRVCDAGGVEVSLPSVGDTTDCVKCGYDASLGPDATQEMLYDEVKGCVSAVLGGINATCFAYGTTGSGKTYSLYGPPEFTKEYMHWGESGCHSQAGVVPRAAADVFNGLRKTSQSVLCNNNGWSHEWGVWCSMIQVYNEQVYDMINDPQRLKPLTIRTDEGEHIKGGGLGSDDVGKASIYCDGLIECSIMSANECLELISMAESHCVIRETHRNVVSSRSHSILQILVEQYWIKDGIKKRRCCAKLNIVDLAGSEKWNVLQESNSEKISELTHINTSLHALGRVVAALSSSSSTSGSAALVGEAAKMSKTDADKGEPSQRGVGSEAAAVPSLVPRSYHVPYRYSKLTRLLQDSLGGNTRTRLIATLSPTVASAHESVSTVRFADRAKKVVSFVKVNDRPSIAAGGENKELVHGLRSEVVKLRGIVRELMFKKDSPAKTESYDSALPAAGSSGTVSPRRKRNNLEVLEAQIEYLKKENAELRNQLAQAGTTKSPSTILQSQQPHLEVMEKATSSIMTALRDFFHFEIEEPELKEAMEGVQSYLRASQMTMKSHPRPENRTLSDICGGNSTTLPSLPSNNKHREVTAMAAGGTRGGFSSTTASTQFGSGSTTSDYQQSSYHKGNSRGGGAALLRTTQPSSPIAFRVRGRGGHVQTSQMLLRGQAEEIDEEETEQKLRYKLQQARLKIHKMALQDWVKQKEEASIRAKEEDKMKLFEKEKEKLKNDEEFRRRAAAVKRRLKNYYAELQAKEKEADIFASTI